MSEEEATTQRLSAEEERTLRSVLDELVPPSRDGRLPGAGQLGLAPVVREQTAALWPSVAQGLAALDALAQAGGASDFASLGAREKVEALDRVEAEAPGFLPGLVFQTYSTYYRHPRVVEALGLEPRPPHPEGYELETGDLSALERVRARRKLYRDA